MSIKRIVSVGLLVAAAAFAGVWVRPTEAAAMARDRLADGRAAIAHVNAAGAPAAPPPVMTPTPQSATSGPPPLLPVADRSFNAALLPGYAAYLIMAGLLAGACAWVARREDGVGPER